MNSYAGDDQALTAADFLRSFHEKGVRLWARNGELHFRAPKSALAAEDLRDLRRFRRDILVLLERAARKEAMLPRVLHRENRATVPLTFSQLAHWQSCGLRQRRSWRGVACGVRVNESLDGQALSKSVAALVRRHEALRIRICVEEGRPTQEILKCGPDCLEAQDLTGLPEDARPEAMRKAINEFLSRPIDVATDSLFAVLSMKIRRDQHVLIVAMEHIVSDARSLRILVRDLHALYMQFAQGARCTLPEIEIQLSDYALWEWEQAPLWIKEHAAYWEKELSGYRPLGFQRDGALLAGEAFSARGRVPIRIDSKTFASLREWCRARRTTLALSLFTAYAATLLRSCNVMQGALKFQFDNRGSEKMENSVGYFSTQLYVPVRLLESDRFVDVLGRVTVDYCRALEYTDLSYLQTLVPRPRFARSALFNWVPRTPVDNDDSATESDGQATWSTFELERPVSGILEPGTEPRLVLFEQEDEIVGAVSFPVSQVSAAAVEIFARNFAFFLEVMLEMPEQRVSDLSPLRLTTSH